MAKKLHYFNLNGIAESIRYILYYTGQKFEDIRYERSEWPVKSVKDALPYGQLPLFEDGDKKLTQSLAIAKYVSAGTALLPSTPWEQAILDSAVFSVYDFWSKIVPYILEQDPVKKAEIKKKIFGEFIEFYLSRFERDLKKNGGYFSGKLSWADFILVGILECADLVLETEVEAKYPSVKALIANVTSLPRVKEYITKRGPYSLMELQNGYFIYWFFIPYFSLYVVAASPNLTNDKIETKASACKNETLQGLCQIKCGDHHACVLGKCFCLQPSVANRNVQDASQSAEPQEIKLLPYNEQLSREEVYKKPTLRHHIAHFCPDLEQARKCIRGCMRHGKPAFCGKDHVCYCGHKYDTPVDDDKLDATNVYAEFKDLYAKYFGIQ
ncbi:hypothetical protein K1T71_006792 [Dendrolimus kikuchii]|uniref:Uncharacterized protein n=1 Tax=Dendrolimus kikuchii TaxID=765133 RepID=A0ACC1D1T5_9NEOP|nr:hypothetical protein K1T71_006792 [Dendrolimus kikuchii]